MQGKLSHLDGILRAFVSYIPNKETTTYVEIGAHKGRSISNLGYEFSKVVNDKLNIIGYDVFDGGDDLLHKDEDNGKGAGNYDKCFRSLKKLSKRQPNVTFKLVKGFTTDTLEPMVADWAFIDGGHSYETVKWDHANLKDSSIIIFDDADLEGVNRYLWEIKDDYKIYDVDKESTDIRRRSVILNIDENLYDFDHANLKEFAGVDPNTFAVQNND